MSNPVLDKLENWQPDSDTIDSNLPVPATSIGVSTSGDLAAELRRIKSEIRGESINKSWERWSGLTSLTTGAPIAFSYGSATDFGVNDDFIAANRFVVQTGRRVKALLAGGMIYGTIVAATLYYPNTSVSVLWDAGGGNLDATLSEIQFGPLGLSLGNSTLRVDHQLGVISNTDQETALISCVIPRNYLGTQNQIELNIDARFGLISGGSVEILAMYGGQQITGIGLANLANTTVGLVVCPVTVTLTAFGTGTQTLALKLHTTNSGNNAPDAFLSTCQNMATAGQTTQNSTVNQSLDVHILFNTADIANQADYLGARLQLFAA